MDAWRSRFQKDNPDVTVNYDPSGSGAGVEKFNAGGIDFAGSDSALNADKGEIDAAKKRCGADAIEVPNYVSPIAVVYNVRVSTTCSSPRRRSPRSSTARSPSGTTRRSPPTTRTPSCPSTTITPVHRSDESGTTENFTDYLEQAGEGALEPPGRQGLADQER